MIRNLIICAASSLALIACSGGQDGDISQDSAETISTATTETTEIIQTPKAQTAENVVADNKTKLRGIINAQPEAMKVRYTARNPAETLEFFGVEPGMTIVEILPGSGWYTKIISPYLGLNGHVIGVDYSLDMWPEFGGFATPKFIEDRKSWGQTWVKDMNEAISSDHSQLSAYTLSTLPSELDGQADMVVMIRALHNLARFNDDGGYLDKALADLYSALKPGGIAGIVQHQGPEENTDDWADGNNGYLKKSFVIAQMEKAGFEFVSESDINANPRDIPSDSDNVWRLPPTLGTSRDDADLRSQMENIGESNRMTLKFVKPE